jgi:hypothetical protein
MTKRDPFKYFKTSPEIIRLAVMLYVRFPLSLRNVADPLHERGIDISYETVRFWWNRFGLLFATEIHKKSVNQICTYPRPASHRGRLGGGGGEGIFVASVTLPISSLELCACDL